MKKRIILAAIPILFIASTKTTYADFSDFQWFRKVLGINSNKELLKIIKTDNNNEGKDGGRWKNYSTPTPVKILTGTPSPSLTPHPKDKRKLKNVFKEGTIDSISGSSFILNPKNGGNKITINISDKTILLRKFGGKSSFSEFHQENSVQIRGNWTDDNKNTIDAKNIRNLSIQKRNATFWGKIKSIDNQTFIIQSLERGELTVKPDSNTKIMSRNEKAISFSDLQTRHRVRVSGVWDSVLKTLDEVKTIKDWSLPAYPTPTPKV